MELDTLFDETYGSTGVNLKGSNKLEFIKTKLSMTGDNFAESAPRITYCGDSAADLEIWKDDAIAGAVITGRKTAQLKSQLEKSGCGSKISEVFPFERVGGQDWLKAMRIHQWAKNALLFVPLLCAFAFFDIEKDLQALIAFMAFSLGASATYILNDLWDLPSDRAHATKCLRPFASGRISIPAGIMMAGLLLILSVACSLVLSFSFFLYLLFYLCLTTMYSLVFKRIVLVDIIVLASLYVTRIVAGNIVGDIPFSYWLFSFAFMVFLSLGTLKRYVELQRKAQRGSAKIPSAGEGEHQSVAGRGYNTGDLDILMALGISTYVGAIVLFGLYITSSEMVRHYSSPQLLWFVQMIFFYLIGDMWFVAKRGV